MAYNLRCNKCDQIFTSSHRDGSCPRHDYRGHGTSLIGEVLETAVDVALVYTGVTAAVEVADAVGGLVGSIFNWD